MTLFERVKELSYSQGKSLKTVALDIGFGENYFYTWKNKTPRADKLKLVASYFGVSTDYLLGNSDDKGKPIDDGFLRLNVSDLTVEERKEVEKELKTFFDYARAKIKDERNKGGDA